jgi:hypothetical protein
MTAESDNLASHGRGLTTILVNKMTANLAATAGIFRPFLQKVCKVDAESLVERLRHIIEKPFEAFLDNELKSIEGTPERLQFVDPALDIASYLLDWELPAAFFRQKISKYAKRQAQKPEKDASR